jgi:integrase
MEHEIASTVSPSALERLIDDAVQEFQRLGYTPETVKGYRKVWEDLLEFSKGEPAPPVFSQALADSFLQSKGISLCETNKRLHPAPHHIRAAIHRLCEFAEHRCFSCKRERWRKSILPVAFENLLGEYLMFWKKWRGRTESAMRTRKGYVEKFLHFLDSRQVSVPDICPGIISDFIASLIHLKPGTVASAASALRGFLRYLCMRGHLAEDLSQQVPVIRSMRYDYLPFGWSSEEATALLGAVDRTSPVGKRDYAILVLAARLGLRAGDIRGLLLEHLNWEEARIEMTQNKTQEVLSLPLTEEVGQALIDYLRYARPQSVCREVFLRVAAPFKPFADSNSFHDVITKYRRLAGIKVPRLGHHGIHAFRHGLATRLLEVQTPFTTISAILGHLSPDSTRVYARVDLKALRTVPLDSEEVLRG